jgi:predicted enzyme related to lactoylglutathione lyase
MKQAPQGRVTGLGGVFVRSRDPEALKSWYGEVLDVPREDGMIVFRPDDGKLILLGVFEQESDYFPVAQEAMLNLRVDDLEAALGRVAAAGAEVDSRRDDSELGRFGWFADPEGNRVELWEPAEGM